MATSNIFSAFNICTKIKEYCLCFWKAVSFLVLFFILPLVSCPALGQAGQNKIFAGTDVSKWGELIIDNVSPDRMWISYKMQNPQGSDTLFIRHVQNHKTYAFQNMPHAEFYADGYVSCRDYSKNITLTDLDSGKKWSYTNIVQMDYSSSSHQLILLDGNTNSLMMINTKNGLSKTYDNVLKIGMSPDNKSVAIAAVHDNRHSVGIVDLLKTSDPKWILENSQNSIEKIIWSTYNDAVALLGAAKSDNKNAQLYFYNIRQNRLSELDPTHRSDFPENKYIAFDQKYQLRISTDLTKVFFCLRQKSNADKTVSEPAEIWHTKDKYIYPYEMKVAKPKERNQLAVWHPVTGSFAALSTPELPNVTLTGDEKFAVLSNPKEYEPQPDKESPRDFYLLNCDNGEKTLIIKRQNPSNLNLISSPTGKYIAYFKERNWWVYDIRTKTHSNITENSNNPFYGKVYLNMDDKSAFGIAGWTADDSELVLYDQYDLWLADPKGLVVKRMTKGREQKIKFRIAAVNELDVYDFVYDGTKSKTINLDSKIMLRAEGADIRSGYYKWTKKNGEIPIVYKDAYLNKLFFMENQEFYIYQEQKFNMAPKIVLQQAKKKPSLVYQSNPEYKKMKWSRSELMHYRNSKGKELLGTLYYPFNYDSSKKYPMVVHVYEKQSNKMHWFNNPNILASNGFNPEILCSEGYFVLAPDIEHENRDIGGSAVDCTVSAVKEIISRGLVDEKKIGLMGHSFGGYETNFIITQTNIFAAAVSGASISDLPSDYLTVEEESSRSLAYKFHNKDYYMMGKTFFEDPDIYYKNSPISNAVSIITPLMLWSGKEDFHVHWYHTVKYYMALRILGKTGTMLLYPGERHDLQKQQNRIDLSAKILQWFDYNLKSNVQAPWIKESLN